MEIKLPEKCVWPHCRRGEITPPVARYACCGKPDPSRHHAGDCCTACDGEYEDGYQGGGVQVDGYCCCRDRRIPEG